jgi:hypothetical protein
MNLQVIGAYLLVSFLHVMWDWLPQLITSNFGSGLYVLLAEGVVGIVGFVVLWARWREAIGLQTVLSSEV